VSCSRRCEECPFWHENAYAILQNKGDPFYFTKACYGMDSDGKKLQTLEEGK